MKLLIALAILVLVQATPLANKYEPTVTDASNNQDDIHMAKGLADDALKKSYSKESAKLITCKDDCMVVYRDCKNPKTLSPSANMVAKCGESLDACIGVCRVAETGKK
jgi:hypothetical protein